MGSSSSDTKATVDMSLDDIIKARRNDSSKDTKRRTNPKRNASSTSNKKQATANRVTGAGKAKRSARLASKRGLSDSNKPSPMEVERETYRLNRSQRGGNVVNANKRNNKTVSDQKVKAKNKKAAAANNNKSSNGNKNVPKKAVNIALQAMRNAGYNYDVPKGSKMVISFAPSSPPPSKPAPQKKNTSNNNNNRGRNNNRGGRR